MKMAILDQLLITETERCSSQFNCSFIIDNVTVDLQEEREYKAMTQNIREQHDESDKPLSIQFKEVGNQTKPVDIF